MADHLATVRAALDLAGKATPGPWYIRHGRDGEACFVIRDEPTREDLLITDSATHEVHANVEAVIALRNATAAIAALCEEVERLRKESRTWFRGEAERQAARAASLESALRAILDAVDAGTQDDAHDAMAAARRLLGEG